MIASIFLFALLVVASHQAEDVNKPMGNIDPNTVSCDPAGKIFLLLPHFTDCSKFFMCSHGEEIEFSCAPGGLIFDFELQTCNWEGASRCVLRTPPEEEIEGSGEDEFDFLSDKADNRLGAVQTLTGDAVANSIRPLSVEASAKSNFNVLLNCLRADSASRQMAYKGDCQRYWRCANGVPQVVYCTDGLYFNERTEQCDFEANAKCQVEQEDELKSEFIAVK